MSNVMKQLGGGGAGQSIMDRIVAAKYSITGEGLARAVCKASTEEISAPKKKHVDYLVQCTNEPNVSIPRMADLLIGRLQHHNWVMVYKALITIHQLMNYGNERFVQYLASNNCTLSLPNFLDKSNVHGYDMSAFVRRYSKYVNEKAVSYRAMAFDFCKVKRGKEDGLLRTMPIDRLLKTIPVLQSQLDVLVEFDAQANDLHNGVINASFILLFKDLIRLFACYNDGMINLLEKFFDLPRKQCRDALDLYKRFLVRMDKVGEFLRVAEAIGVDKGEIPDLARAPASLLEALEAHLANLEGGQPPAPGPAATGAKRSPPNAGTPVGGLTPTTKAANEDEKRRILEDEARRIEAFQKAKATAPTNAQPPAAAAAPTPNPFDLFGASPPQSQPVKPANNVDQLFSLETATAAPPQGASNAVPNPFFGVAGAQPVLPATNPFLFTSNPVGVPVAGPPAAWSGAAPFGANNAASKPINFDAAFGNTAATNGSNAFGNVLQPSNSAAAARPATASPTNAPAPGATSLITADIDSSIASLAGNLTVSGGYKKPDWSGAGQQPKQQTGAPKAGAPAQSVAAQLQSSANPFGPAPGGILQPQTVASPPPSSSLLQNQLPQLYALRTPMSTGAGFGLTQPPPTATFLQYPAVTMPTQAAAWPYGQPAPTQQPNDPFGAL